MNKLDNFKNKFLEIKEELKALNPNNESIVDGVIAPIFFVVLANFVELNTAIYSTAILLTSLLVLRLVQKQNVKFVIYGFIGSLVALAIARRQGSSSGFFLIGIVRDSAIGIIGILSILVGRPFTIYSSKAFRYWPKDWYFHKKVKPAYSRVAMIWSIYLILKAGLQIYFYENAEILVLIKLATSNQTTIILLVVSYIYGQNQLKKLKGPSVKEFINDSPEPWEGQLKGF